MRSEIGAHHGTAEALPGLGCIAESDCYGVYLRVSSAFTANLVFLPHSALQRGIWKDSEVSGIIVGSNLTTNLPVRSGARSIAINGLLSLTPLLTSWLPGPTTTQRVRSNAFFGVPVPRPNEAFERKIGDAVISCARQAETFVMKYLLTSVEWACTATHTGLPVSAC